MENLEKRGESQGSLFQNSIRATRYFLTTQRNLMSFLGSGMIMPSGSQFRYKVDTREEYFGAIPFWKGSFPELDSYSSLLDDERAVVIECDVDDIMKYGGRYLVMENEHLIVVNAPIPLWCVSSVYMHSNGAIDDFLMRLPDDVIADRVVFRALPEIPMVSAPDRMDIKEPEDIQPQLNFIDAFGGGLKALQHFSAQEISDYSYVLDLLPICIASNELNSSQAEVVDVSSHKPRITNSDRSILIKILPVLKDIKPEDGFDPIYLLDTLEASLQDDKSLGFEDVDKWLSYVRKVLESEIEVPVLGDEGDIFKRAVLLFLLRPDLDRLIGSVDSAISPGPAVLSIAAFMAGYTSGISRMGPEYKGDYRAYNKFIKSLLDSLWCKSKFSLNSVREHSANYGASLMYEINNEALLEFRIEQDVILARVLNQAKSAGYDLVYDFDNSEIHYTFELEDGRSQTVYIERLKPLADGFDVIRFVSPCLDLSKAITRTLNRTKAVDFLKRNADESMYCSFAYSERRKAIVVEATQLVRTMDDDEFVTLLNYVAKIADEYERDVLGKDNY